MFELGTPAWSIAARSALVYLAIFGGLRLAGKRELGQMTVFDLVVILLIANAVQNAMVGPDTSLQGGLLAGAILLVSNRVAAALRLHGRFWGRLLEGTPTVLIQEGRFVEPNLRKEEIDRDDVERVIREHGLESADAVKLAVLETDGSISIVPTTSPVVRSKRSVRQLRKR